MAQKLDAEPRLTGQDPTLVRWARRVVAALNACVDFLNQWAVSNTSANNSASIKSTTGGATLGVDSPQGQSSAIAGYRSGSTRWQIAMPDAETEGGSNAGSNFQISRFSDTGVAIDVPLQISRQFGAVLHPSQPRFACTNCSAATAGTDITWGAPSVNVGGCFNNANGRFTAPVSGTYFFRTNVLGNAAAAGEVRIGLMVNGVAAGGSSIITTKAASQFQTVQTQAFLNLSAGDFVTVRNLTSPEALFAADANFSSFSGSLVA